MSGYRNFAVLGAGTIGKYLVEELLRAKAAGTVSTVLVVSRSEIKTPEWEAKGAEFAVVDYDSTTSLTSTFANIDVVISTLSRPALAKQGDIAKAAKAASVKLFVPSEFGLDSRNVSEGIHLVKKQVHDKLKEINLPYSLFVTGRFTDIIFIPQFGFNLGEGKVNIGGTGNAPVSFISRSDIARYLTHVLTALPASKLEWSTFRIEGDRLSLKEVVSVYENKTGKKLEVTHTPQEELKETLANNPADFATYMMLLLDAGDGTVGDGNDNDLFPEWNPQKVSDIIA